MQPLAECGAYKYAGLLTKTKGGAMDIVEQMRSFESDHEPDGWPAIQMKQVSALCDEVERLRADIATACNNIPVAFAPQEKTGESLVTSINDWRNHVVESTVSLTNIANKFEESSIRYFSERNKLRDEIDRSQSLLNGVASEVERLQSLLEQERQESLTSSCRVAALEMELDSAHPIPAQQSPAVAVPEWISCADRLPKKEDADIAGNVTCRWHGGEIVAIPWRDVEVGDDEWLCARVVQSPRITEQDAREIAKDVFEYVDARNNPQMEGWEELCLQGLLAKLNEAKHD